MKLKLLSVFFISSCIFSTLLARRIMVVTASYNNSKWYQKNLDSILCQDHDDFHVLYIDDASPDGTGDLVEAYLKDHPKKDKVTLIKNEQRQGAMANQYDAIHSCDDKAIIVIVDGDDFLTDAGVLSYINKVYTESDTWLTYGQFKEVPSGRRGFCCAMPPSVVQKNNFRGFNNIPSHLRTFYAGLFKRIKKEDLMHEGAFLQMCADIAMMFPMIEMARNGHFKFISKILYDYNASNPISDHRVSKKLQRKLDLVIRGRKRYEALEKLFGD